METKTEELPDLKLTLAASSTVADLQQVVSKQCGWEPIDKLERYALLFATAPCTIMCVCPRWCMERLHRVRLPMPHAHRLEGFKDPWEHVVYRGKLLQPTSTLSECGVDAHAPVVAVRRSLLPEGMHLLPSSYTHSDRLTLSLLLCAAWKIIQDDEEDFSSSDDGF